MDIKVPNKDHARFVERCVAKDLRRAFVTQCTEDRELLNKLKSEHGFKDMYMINCLLDPSKVKQSPVPLEQLKCLGVTHYVRDMIEAEPLLIDLLCDMSAIHRTAYGTAQAEKHREKIFTSENVGRGLQ